MLEKLNELRKAIVNSFFYDIVSTLFIVVVSVGAGFLVGQFLFRL